jgi:hypothetical protein
MHESAAMKRQQSSLVTSDEAMRGCCHSSRQAHITMSSQLADTAAVHVAAGGASDVCVWCAASKRPMQTLARCC